MRNLNILSLAGLLSVFLFASCDSATGQTNQNDVHAEIMGASPEIPLLPAPNITQKTEYISACYDNGGAAICQNGQASIATSKLPQTEIEGGFSDALGVWTCANSVNGDYVEINPFTGVTTAKIAGRMIVLLPENGTAFAATKE